MVLGRENKIEDHIWKVPTFPLEQGKGCMTVFQGEDEDHADRVRWSLSIDRHLLTMDPLYHCDP